MTRPVAPNDGLEYRYSINSYSGVHMLQLITTLGSRKLDTIVHISKSLVNSAQELSSLAAKRSNESFKRNRIPFLKAALKR